MSLSRSGVRPVGPENGERRPEPGERGRTVLIVEDDDGLRETLAKGLARHGFHVLTAATAAEALERAEAEGEIDVLVLDIVLPDSWGAQVALAHTAFQPQTKFIYMSGHAQDDSVLRASVDVDEVPFLEKPFEVSELVEVIERTLAEASK